MPSSQNDIGIFASQLNPVYPGFSSVTVSGLSYVQLPDVPAVVNLLLIQPTQPVRYTDNGVSSPSATDGILIPANTPFQYQVTDFSLIRFAKDASATTDAVLNILAYSYVSE